MKWKRGGSSDDIIDARGGGGGGGRMRLPGGRGGQVGGGLGVAGIIIFLAIQLLGGGGGSGGGFPIDSAFDGGSEAPQAAPIDPAQDPERDLRDFSAYVFTRAQDTWEDIFARSGDRYERAKLVLFREGVRTGCGPAGSEVGPFYCPPDKRAYVDLSLLPRHGVQAGRVRRLRLGVRDRARAGPPRAAGAGHRGGGQPAAPGAP